MRFVFFTLIFLASLFVHPLIVAPMAILYAFRWYALELMIVAILIDSYFDTVAELPIYTIGAFVIWLGAELSKRYVRAI